MKINQELVEQAYKKLKSSVYFDRTLPFLRNDIVKFELKHKGKKLDDFLGKISNAINDNYVFEKFTDEICSKIDVVSLPKKLENNGNDIITNAGTDEIIINELQHYIDLPVEGHILGVLWIMLLGYRIDNKFYEHSYGNRIRKKLYNELSNKPTYSPYLFEPYFAQYESWRDRALSEAQKHMNEKQDIVILTLDFKRYYYSLDVDEKVMDELFDDAGLENEDLRINCKKLNSFIGKVIAKYSDQFGEFFDKKHILPIGFLPSNIIGNWFLNKFDKAIIDGWNPVYYGRYVDDILIVDKIESNGDIYQKAISNKLKSKDIIEFFLTNCTKWNGLVNECKTTSFYSLLKLDEKLTDACKKESGKKESEDSVVYKVNEFYYPGEGNKTEIIVQNDKVKIFYFKYNESDSLITCFKKNILKNISEFRYLPEDESVFQYEDYSDIYSLKSDDSINKFRGIDGIKLDKYELSKFLGKYLRIGGMIQDFSETRFERDILKIFNYRAIIENYTMWEKIIEIFVINEHFDSLIHFCKKIKEAIDKTKYTEKRNGLPETLIDNVPGDLLMHLHAALCKSFALVWKEEREKIKKEIYIDILNDPEFLDFDQLTKGYYFTKMIDKSVMPIFIDMLDFKDLKVANNINLTRFNEVLAYTKKGGSKFDYKYYPYIISMYDFSIISCIEQMNLDDSCVPFCDIRKIVKTEKERYLRTNYVLEISDKEDNHIKHNVTELITVKEKQGHDNNIYMISVGKEKRKELNVAIANVKLNESNFDAFVKGKPNRSYKRYKDLAKIVNMAINEHADMLIMPESFLPFEWLNILARTCAKNNLAIVTGIEHMNHIVNGINRVYNFTATILPFVEDTHKCASISFHLKKHYAPHERELLEGYRFKPIEGKNYELYKWKDCYFPVYCCYELTSIVDRSIFQSYADMIITVEWNKDINYYSNILESLSRDIHCYCVQVNYSKYGDSRITKPSKTEEKDIIRTKGGRNSSILIDKVNFSDLRDFQVKEFSLQSKDGRFKTTPPNFNKDLVMDKIKGNDLDKYGDWSIEDKDS